MELCDLSEYRKCYVPPTKHLSSALPPSPPESPKSSQSGSSTRTASSKRKKGTKSSKASSSMTGSTITAPNTLDDMSEAILALVEQSIEQQMKKQMNCFGTQNHTLNEQIHLHYMSIQRQNEIFDSQIKALSSLATAQAETIQNLQLHTADLHRMHSDFRQPQTSPTRSPSHFSPQKSHKSSLGHVCLRYHTVASPPLTPTNQSHWEVFPSQVQKPSRDQEWTDSVPITRISLDRVKEVAQRRHRKSGMRKFLDKLLAAGM